MGDLGGVRIGKVDCTRQANLSSRFGIRGFPTLLYFTGTGNGASANSKIYKHPGERSLDVLAEFARGGWQNVSEYDPSAVPPPRKRPWLFRDGNMLYILGGMFLVSLT